MASIRWLFNTKVFDCNWMYVSGLAFIVKAVCKGLKAAKEATPDPSGDTQKIIKYFDTVDFVKHSQDGFAVAMKFEEMALHKEHIPLPMLSSKEVCII